MKTHKPLFILLIMILICATHITADAQYRDDVPSGYDWTGPVTKPAEEMNSGIPGLMDFRMDHSYEMSVGSFGGDMYNQNYYTNTMHLLFNENLYGRVDLAFAHSPFGNGIVGEDGTQFFVRNAELNYRFNERSQIRLSFSQMPQSRYNMYNPYGMGYGAHSPLYNPYSPYSRRGGWGSSNFHGW